ncbi:hypothetical protein M427DRAFT_156837, partial [Gonapodya prolifera JEL478]
MMSFPLSGYLEARRMERAQKQWDAEPVNPPPPLTHRIRAAPKELQEYLTKKWRDLDFPIIFCVPLIVLAINASISITLAVFSFRAVSEMQADEAPGGAVHAVYGMGITAAITASFALLQLVLCLTPAAPFAVVSGILTAFVFFPTYGFVLGSVLGDGSDSDHGIRPQYTPAVSFAPDLERKLITGLGIAEIILYFIQFGIFGCV